ncbi:MAG TPA: site-specific DNA-methyltransferase, partial [Gaiellales bacterium]|nr:site-specific DNA-methyltransferase [Gaiellales bacterium]
MPGTQAALYAEIDLELSWSESALPQSERTKHVHGLHPYLGKFPPQLAEALIRRHCPRGGLVLDPFCGSGTTLVEAVALGRDAVGCDISGFNALLAREKVRAREAAAVAAGLEQTLARAESALAGPGEPAGMPPYLAEWYGEEARRELLAYRRAIEPETVWAGLASLVLTRAARSARLVRHDALDAAREPVREPYWCHKHRRTCLPTSG